MIDADTLLAILVASALAIFAVAALMGGLLTSVGGLWQDGDRLIELWQVGPRLSGRCPREGGHELYRGWALFGRVWLARASVGDALLLAMGLPRSALKQLNGAVSARFRFRLCGDRLDGEFLGTQFHFTGEPQKLAGTTVNAPTVRQWLRKGG